jgi:hypothetical protein
VIRNLAAYRTPDEVFYDPAVRMPIRKPDASFAFLFFDLIKGGRMVGPNGIRHEGRLYRLASLQKHLEYFGERVDVRTDPDNQCSAMIFDRGTGAFVCKASADVHDATYNTRDEITRRLIARVFSDGKELMRMAQAHVEGAKERFAEYRRARIAHLVERAREIAADREAKKAALSEAAPVAVISSFSAIAREGRSGGGIGRTHVRTRRGNPSSRGSREAGAAAPLHRLDTSASRTSRGSLLRYKSGKLPWPEGMKERFEEYERLRATLPSDAVPERLPPEGGGKPRRTRADGELSFRSIAEALGMSLKTLERCRQGKRAWPDEGTERRFEELERRRTNGS